MLTDSTSTTSTATAEDSAQVAARLAGTTRIHVTRRDLLGAMRAARSHACEDFTRPQLCGVAVSLVGSMLQLIASDGKTIARVRIHCADDNRTAMPEAHCLLASRDVECMIKDLAFKRKAEGDQIVTLAIRGRIDRESGRPYGRGTIALDVAGTQGHACDLQTFAFPDTSHVIPAAGKRRTDGVIGLDPYLMARLMDVPRMLGRETRSTRGVVVSMGAELDPVRVSWEDPAIGEFLGVICPMRLG